MKACCLSLLFGLLHIQHACCDQSTDGLSSRPSPKQDLWKLISHEDARKHPYSGTVRLRQHNLTRALTAPYPGIGAYDACSGTVIAWNMVLTAAHCMFDAVTGYQWEVVDMIPGGPARDIVRDRVTLLESQAPTPFGTYFSSVALDVLIHWDYNHQTGPGQENDLAIVIIDGAFERTEDYADSATMKLNMLESHGFDEDESIIPETIGNDDMSFRHFPAEYPFWLLGWGRMHQSFGSDVWIKENGFAEFYLNQLGGSSGSSIKVPDLSEIEDGGAPGQESIRIVQTGVARILYEDGVPVEGGYAYGIALSPDHLWWIAETINDNKADVDQLDQGLSPGLETEACMCKYPDDGITVRVVLAPADENCLCGDAEYTPVE